MAGQLTSNSEAKPFCDVCVYLLTSIILVKIMRARSRARYLLKKIKTGQFLGDASSAFGNCSVGDRFTQTTQRRLQQFCEKCHMKSAF